jgi:sugar phosphate isomerase/epimerase
MRVPLVRVVGASVPAGETEESVWPRLRDSFKEVTEHGCRHAVRVGLHNHNHGAVPATGGQILRLLDEIDDPYLQHIVDTGQFRGSPGASGQQERADRAASEELYAHIEATIPRASVVRTKFYRNADGRERWLDYDRIFRIIRASGFNGPLSIVYEGHDALDEEVAIPNAVTELRSLAKRYGV